MGDQFVFTTLILDRGGLPRRAWLTLTLALMHERLYEYVRATSRRLDAVIRELKKLEPTT